MDYDQMDYDQMDYDQYVEFLLEDHRGIYLPQNFVELFDIEEWMYGLSAAERRRFLEEAEVVARGPDEEFYYDSWDYIERTARYRDPAGNIWMLVQEQHLFAVREDVPEDFWDQWMM